MTSGAGAGVHFSVSTRSASINSVIVELNGVGGWDCNLSIADCSPCISDVGICRFAVSIYNKSKGENDAHPGIDGNMFV